MTRRERVHCSPEGGDQQREQHEAHRELTVVDQSLEPAARVDVMPRPRRAREARPRPAPGVSSTVADLTSRGERRRSLGYERSASDVLSDGAVVRTISAPSRAMTVISRQPMRSAYARSAKVERRPAAPCSIDGVETKRLEASCSRSSGRRASSPRAAALDGRRAAARAWSRAPLQIRAAARGHRPERPVPRRGRARSGRRHRCRRASMPA